jgi:hypothetical protein
MSRKRASEVIICQHALARGRKLPDYELVKQNELELVHVGPRASFVTNIETARMPSRGRFNSVTRLFVPEPR